MRWMGEMGNVVRKLLNAEDFLRSAREKFKIQSGKAFSCFQQFRQFTIPAQNSQNLLTFHNLKEQDSQNRTEVGNLEHVHEHDVRSRRNFVIKQNVLPLYSDFSTFLSVSQLQRPKKHTFFPSFCKQLFDSQNNFLLIHLLYG